MSDMHDDNWEEGGGLHTTPAIKAGSVMVSQFVDRVMTIKKC